MMEVFYSRLSLITTSLPRDIPHDLVAMTTVVLFWPEVAGLHGILLNQLLWQQNRKIAQERCQLRKVRNDDFVKMIFSQFFSAGGSDSEREVRGHGACSTGPPVT